jgi:hypothetical protein
MSQLVGVNMSDAGSFGDTTNHSGDSMPIDSGEMVSQQPTGLSDPIGVVGLPRGDEFNQFWMQWDVAVVAEFPDGDMEPVVLPDLDYRIWWECTEFPDPHPGAGQQQDTQLSDWDWFEVGVVHELGHRPVVEELR